MENGKSPVLTATSPVEDSDIRARLHTTAGFNPTALTLLQPLY
jgi:hypothetical protein